jgi:hypothetical protein
MREMLKLSLIAMFVLSLATLSLAASAIPPEMTAASSSIALAK